MPFDPNSPDLVVGVVGSGTMGRGIVQVTAEGGMRCKVFDANTGAAQKAKEFIAGMLTRQVEKGRMAADAARAAADRIEIVGSLADLADCHVVIEAVFEELKVKLDLFAELDAVCGEETILATNTSSLSVTEISTACKHRARVAGLHYFNPVPLMKLVEVVDGMFTAPWVGDALTVLGRRQGRVPVRCGDTPGFIVNHCGRGFAEGIRILSEGIAQPQDIDRVMRDVGGFRMGPFQLMDLTGIDINFAAGKAIYDQYFQEPRFRPFVIHKQRFDAGLYGRKTGRGWYGYEEGQASHEPPEAPAPPDRPGRVWVSAAEPDGQRALTELLRKLDAEIDDGAEPRADSLCIVTPFGQDCTTAAVDQGLDPKRTVAVDTCFPMDGRRTLMGNPLTDPAALRAAHGLLASDGMPVTVIKDSPGFIAQRAIAHIVNIGCDAAQQRVARPQDIDTAVTLGLNYPYGPLAYGDRIGPARVLQILRNMQDFYGDPRYRPSAWLTRRARLGVSLLTED